MPDLNGLVKMAIPAAAALFGARVAQNLTKQSGVIGFVVEVAGAVAGTVLASKLLKG